MANPKKSITLWQWNCRGYSKKKQSLQLLIQAQQSPPQIITLQETGKTVSLPGYRAFQNRNSPLTAILVHRNIPAVREQFENTDVKHDFVTIHPTQKQEDTLHILNVYSPPKAHRQNFKNLFTLAKNAAGSQPLIITGDYNAPHRAWGYPTDTAKGRNLWEQIQQLHFTLENDPQTPTRIGNSVQRDTTPDLTLTHRIKQATWQVTEHTLNSDHYIIQITIPIGNKLRQLRKSPNIIDWPKFRLHRQNQQESQETTSLERWTQQLLEDVKLHTKTPDETLPDEIMDPHLLHLREAYHSIQKRWRKNKLNHRLRRKLAKLGEAIQKYTAQLAQTQWDDICNQMQGNLGMKRTWQLLKHLIDPNNTKSETTNRITHLVQSHKGGQEDLISQIKDTYFPETSPDPIHPYRGEVNHELDKEITESELRGALHKLRTQSAPGPDKITNKILRNLDDTSITTLTALFNAYWTTETLPQEWKHAKVTFIPKPGKSLKIENLRPISLTSCLGKLLEHIIHARLTQHLSRLQIIPPTMIGFQAGLSTQDILLQLKQEIITPANHFDTAAILALDLHKAFDNVKHSAILNNLQATNPGQRTYRYIQNFLSNRTATISVGDVQSDTITLPAKGTPQGAVLSPLLFNLAILNIPKELNKIPTLKYTLYADDITLWIHGGSDAHIEHTLQKGVEAVSKAANEAGLTCSPYKSELLLLPPKRKKEKTPPQISLHIQQHQIPIVKTIRILGLHIQANRSNTIHIKNLSTHVNQTICLMKRITNRRAGLRERDRIRLIQAFVISRITYSIPYLHLSAQEMKAINTLIRKAYKAALRIPLSTSNARLDELGIYNNCEELIEAHLTNQSVRLTKTTTGRHILKQLRINPPAIIAEKEPIPLEIRNNLIIKPLPKHMHPTHHQYRRELRAQYLQKRYPPGQNTLFVDAAEYRHKTAFAIVVTKGTDEPPVHAITIRTKNPAEAEEAAIAVALTQRPTPPTIISDSKTAIQNFAQGNISSLALKILQKNPPSPQ